MLSAATMLAVALVAAAYTAIVGAKKEGMVEYVGAQRDVFKTGKAASVVSSSFSAARRECNKIYS